MKKRYSSGNIFTDVKVEKFPRHSFSKDYITRLTCDHGLLEPILCKFVKPGDRFDISTMGRIQLQPLATSTMQNIKCYIRYFYVPFRLVWENFDKFMTQDSQSEIAIQAPYTVLNGEQLNELAPQVGKLHDLLGLGIYNPAPKEISDLTGLDYIQFDPRAKLQFNLFKWAGYHLIWDYYFRDENLQEPIFQPLEDGYQDYSLTKLQTLLPVAWEKDYFTTALPWAQKGEPVNLSAYVGSGTFDSPSFDLGKVRGWYVDSNEQYALNVVTDRDGMLTSSPIVSDERIEFGIQSLDVPGNVLSTSININDLRYSNALQRFLERKALGGSRPSEFYLSMYGVRVDDLRIGQPLYLGGGCTDIVISDVKQLSQTTLGADGSALGTLAGDGKVWPKVSMNNPYYAQEFGMVYALMYIRPEINYTQGLPREMQWFDTLDFYNPIFAHLGEEEVKVSELFVDPNINNTTTEYNNDSTFGYQSRYAYLKHNRNETHGEFLTSLSHWTLGTSFSNKPTLSDEFITVDQNYDIFAVVDSNSHHYLCEFFHKFDSEDSMPNFVYPSL